MYIKVIIVWNSRQLYGVACNMAKGRYATPCLGKIGAGDWFCDLTWCTRYLVQYAPGQNSEALRPGQPDSGGSSSEGNDAKNSLLCCKVANSRDSLLPFSGCYSFPWTPSGSNYLLVASSLRAAAFESVGTCAVIGPVWPLDHNVVNA